MTLPLDPQSLADIAAAQTTRDTKITDLGTSRTLAASEYGYTPTYDANGYVQALAMDPNNPNAKAGLLKQSYDNRLAINKQNFANRGQQYAGSFGVAQSLADQDFTKNSSNLQRTFIAFIARNQGGINAATTGYESAYGQALAGNVTRAAANDTGQGAPEAAPEAAPAAGPAAPFNSTGFAGLDPSKRYRQASNGRLQVQNSNGTWRYASRTKTYAQFVGKMRPPKDPAPKKKAGATSESGAGSGNTYTPTKTLPYSLAPARNRWHKNRKGKWVNNDTTVI